MQNSKEEYIEFLKGDPITENENIFAGISLDNGVGFVLSESFRVKFFDIRKADREVSSIAHFSEEAPPTILQLYSGDKRHISL